MPTVLGQLAQEAGRTAVNTGMGLLLQKHNDRRQLRQQKKLGQQQLGINIQQLNHQQQLQKELYDYTSYPYQIEKMKEAGLSPSLMYGGSGPGASTTGSTGSGVTQPSAPAGGNEIMGLQMMGAQRALIEAQTAKTNAEAKKISGVDTDEARTRIESITQGIDNQKATERLTRVQAEIAELDEMIKTESYDDVIRSIHWAARQAKVGLDIMVNDRQISDETIKEKIGIIQQELIGIGLQNELRKSQTDLTDEQTKKTIADVQQAWKKLTLDERNTVVQELNAITNTKNAETNARNAHTNVRQYFENVRKTDYDHDIRRKLYQLEKFIRDTPDSMKVTVGALQSILGSATRLMPTRIIRE